MAKPTQPIPPDRHGTPSGYRYWACRCDDCRAAANWATIRTKLTRIERPAPRKVHGTLNGYNNYDCRCEACRCAARAARLARKLWPAEATH